MCEAILPLILGIVAENFGDEATVDTQELDVVLAKLQEFDPSLW